MKRKEKGSLGSRLCHALELSPDLLPNSVVAEMHGDSLVKIQGGGRILLYTDTEIRIALKGKGRFLSVRGEELCCNSYNMGTVGIEGRICSVSFCDKEGEL